MATLLAATGCAGLSPAAQGLLQPQAISGPCQVKKFYLLALTAVPTEMTLDAGGEACTFTVINPDAQAFPSAVLVTEQPSHGKAIAGLINGGRSPVTSYTPQPGYTGLDRFTITIEPNDRAIAVAVTVAQGKPQSAAMRRPDASWCGRNIAEAPTTG